MSKTGLSLCGLYAVVIVGCVDSAFLGGLDAKSRFIFLQIPIMLQSALSAKLGLTEVFQNVIWVTAYIVFAGPVFVLLYVLGLMLETSFLRRIGRR